MASLYPCSALGVAVAAITNGEGARVSSSKWIAAVGNFFVFIFCFTSLSTFLDPAPWRDAEGLYKDASLLCPNMSLFLFFSDMCIAPGSWALLLIKGLRYDQDFALYGGDRLG